jgi:polar amino acid transport system permease protein
MVHLATIVSGSEMSSLLSGLLLSLKVTGLTLLLGFPLGIMLAVLVMSQSRVISYLTIVVVEILRGMPTLVFLSLLYYGLPDKGLTLSALAVAVGAFTLQTAAYSSEFFRGSLRSVPLGQREAAASTGLSSKQAFWSVVLPQAVRIAVPQMVSFAIAIFQGTAILFAIALPELLSRAYQIGTFTFEFMRILLVAAALYAVISIPAAQFVGWIERRTTARL